MDMDQAAVFLAGSILTAMGFVVIAIAIVFVNNILNKYWKPVRIFTLDSWHINPPATSEEMEKIAPHLDTTSVDKKAR
jgi:hypothetical protein